MKKIRPIPKHKEGETISHWHARINLWLLEEFEHVSLREVHRVRVYVSDFLAEKKANEIAEEKQKNVQEQHAAQ